MRHHPPCGTGHEYPVAFVEAGWQPTIRHGGAGIFAPSPSVGPYRLSSAMAAQAYGQR